MALLVTNFAGFPATLLYGYFGHRFGPKRGIYFALATYVAMSCWAVFMKDVWQFYVMAVVIGCVQGGVQGLSRSLYASLIPEQQPGEFFGFYNTLTKFAHVLGPMLVAIAATLSDDPKWVLLTLVPLSLAWLLWTWAGINLLTGIVFGSPRDDLDYPDLDARAMLVHGGAMGALAMFGLVLVEAVL